MRADSNFRQRGGPSKALIVRILFAAAAFLLVLSGSNISDLFIDATDLGPGVEPYKISQDLNSDLHIRMEHGTASVDNTGWTTISLTHEYESMVVIAVPNYDASAPPLVTRVQNATAGTSFDLRVQRADGLTTATSAIDVHYMVIEEGVYTAAAHGVTMEAVRYLSTLTDGSNGGWTGESRTYANSYTSPVVIGQVMTYNDVDWSVFWARGQTAKKPPTPQQLSTGKHTAEHPDGVRVDETVGYIVIEAGSGSIEGMNFITAVGANTVRGFDDSPPFTYVLSGLSSASTAVVSTAGMGDIDGAWPVLYGTTPLTSTTLDLAAQEDQELDPEMTLQTEQMAYLVFE